MTRQVIRIYESPEEGSVVELIYDDAALICSAAHIRVGASALPLVSSFVIDGEAFTQSYPPGTDAEIVLPVALTVVAGTGRGGATSVGLRGLDSVVFGHGA